MAPIGIKKKQHKLHTTKHISLELNTGVLIIHKNNSLYRNDKKCHIHILY